MRSRPMIPFFSRRQSTTSLPRMSIGKIGLIAVHAASVRSNRAISWPSSQRTNDTLPEPCQPLKGATPGPPLSICRHPLLNGHASIAETGPIVNDEVLS